MFARVTTVEGDPDTLEAGVKLIQETVIPTARELPGFQGGYWLADRDAGKMLGITLWASKDELDASEETANRLRTDTTQEAGSTIGSVERFEVVAQA